MIVNVKIQDETYVVIIQDLNERPIIARVGDETFEIWPEENSPAPIIGQKPAARPETPAKRQSQMSTDEAKYSSKSLQSPLPGVITHISVSIGESIKAGQEVMRLEAMKMSNIIRSTQSGTVSKICATVGQQVKHGEVLVMFEDTSKSQ